MSTTPAKMKKVRKTDPQWSVADDDLREKQNLNRRQLATQFSAFEELRLDNARRMMDWNLMRTAESKTGKQLNLVANALRPRLAAVIASWNVRAPLVLKSGPSARASTDFRSIFVQYKGELANDEENYRQLAAQIRGMTYHELGHILYTTPFAQLIEQALRDGWTYAPSWTRTTFTMMNGEVPDAFINILKNRFQHYWNVLEDQRMEMSMVTESPRLAAYYTVMVMQLFLPNENHLRENYPLVVGRTYLSKKLRRLSREAYAATHPKHDIAELQRIVRKYLMARTATTMMEAIIQFVKFLSPHDEKGNSDATLFPPFGTNGTTQPNSGEGDGPVHSPNQNPLNDVDLDDDKNEENDEENEGEGDEEGEEDNDTSTSGKSTPSGEEGDAGASSGDDGDDDGTENEPGTKAGNTDGPNVPSPQEALDELTAEALKKRDDDFNLDQDVQALNSENNQDPDDGLTMDQNSAALSPADEARAEQLANDIERTFQIATADQAPTWQGQQRAGILEALRYRTRQPGDRDFYRSYAEHGEQSRDIEVSVILDISASMSSHENSLGITAYACKVGCYRLGIPCEVVLFNTNAKRFYRKDDEPILPVSIQTQGGTDPEHLFRQILTYPRDTKIHLVLIMTDGEWEKNPGNNLALYKEANRYVIAFQFDPKLNYQTNKWGTTAMERRRVSMQDLLDRNPDEAYAIGSLEMVPQTLESVLATLVAQL